MLSYLYLQNLTISKPFASSCFPLCSFLLKNLDFQHVDPQLRKFFSQNKKLYHKFAAY